MVIDISIRSFEGETWICGWFDEDGNLIDIQQYNNDNLSVEVGELIEKGFFPFVGKITDVVSSVLERKRSED
jgi:hypothetical protein